MRTPIDAKMITIPITGSQSSARGVIIRGVFKSGAGVFSILSQLEARKRCASCANIEAERFDGIFSGVFSTLESYQQLQ